MGYCIHTWSSYTWTHVQGKKHGGGGGWKHNNGMYRAREREHYFNSHRERIQVGGKRGWGKLTNRGTGSWGWEWRGKQTGRQRAMDIRFQNIRFDRNSPRFQNIRFDRNSPICHQESVLESTLNTCFLPLFSRMTPATPQLTELRLLMAKSDVWGTKSTHLHEKSGGDFFIFVNVWVAAWTGTAALTTRLWKTRSWKRGVVVHPFCFKLAGVTFRSLLTKLSCSKSNTKNTHKLV